MSPSFGTVDHLLVATSDPTTAPSTSTPVICNLDDYQRRARKTLPAPLYEYLASGTDDERTLHCNRHAFLDWFLRPRVMRPVQNISTRTTLFGCNLAAPVFVSPAGVHGLVDPAGERATAAACGRFGTICGVSQHSTASIEEVAETAPETDLWYQSYILVDRDATLNLVKRAVDAGYKGIVLTADSVRFGRREADVRNGESPTTLKKMRRGIKIPKKCLNRISHGMTSPG